MEMMNVINGEFPRLSQTGPELTVTIHDVIMLMFFDF